MLKFIGTGSAFNEEMGNTSAFIKEEDTLLLIDCGESTFARIKQINLLDDVKNVYIAITHFHSDHVGSLGTLIEYLALIKNIVPNIILTNGASANEQENYTRDYLTKLGIADDQYDFVYGDMMEDVLPNLLKIEMVKVKHSSRLISYAVELYFAEKTIYYTGDQKDVSYLEKVANKLNKNDIIYTDCSLRDYPKSIHISFAELEEIFAEEIRNQVVCMHFENYSSYSEARQLGFKTANKEMSKEEILKQIVNRK